jgi:outer membrane receptor protein involved in Fe transport
LVACVAGTGVKPTVRAADKPPAAARVEARVNGTVLTPETRRPVEFAAVTLKRADDTVVVSAITDQRGRFTLEKIPAGDYAVVYGRVGGVGRTTAVFQINAARTQIDLGRLELADEPLQLKKFEVTAKQSAQLNAIDRKIYNVGRDIHSVTGTASDLLQNVPSVDVDLDGNVSLRGSDNVLILINGRTSTLMGQSRAEVLQQLPANSIEKIEVITNPSAKYKPDGTAGIINLVLKQRHDAGLSGTVSFNVGNNRRYNSSLALNFRPGPVNFFASYGVRQDDRYRAASDLRTITDPVTGVVTRAEKRTVEVSRPISHLGRLGLDYAPDAADQFGLSANYNDRRHTRRATDQNRVGGAAGILASDYDRVRYAPDFEPSTEVAGTYQHNFADEGHELKVELKSSDTKEDETNHYTNTYRTPVQAPTFDNVLVSNLERSHEASVDYARPLGGEAKLESGYDLTRESRDSDFTNAYFDSVTGAWVEDLAKSNRFILDRTIHAFYATYARTFGSVGVQAGVRPEITTTSSQLVTTGQTIPNDYARVYPSLHLTYHFAEAQEWQLNYSHRIHRPGTEDLNPFPEYLDPFTLRAGNPHLRPEDIHSIETGYSYHQDDTSFTATGYYRYTYHRFTDLTTNLGNGILLNTRENLAVNRASGLELTANAELGGHVTLNFSSNTFFNTIDASNLGYSSSRSDGSLLAKVGLTWRLTPATQLQLNTKYATARLTPQGEQRPMFVANAGLRHDLWQKQAALVLTVSDLFNSLKNENIVNTPLLHEDIVLRRSSRIIYLGITYNFGQPGKKSKDDALKFDNSL